MDIIIILLLAFIVDLALGDPPDAFHPVAWMGKVISLLEKPGMRWGPAGQFISGVLLVLFVMGLFAAPAYFILDHLKDVSFIAYVVVAAVFLKLTFSIRGLRMAALRVKSMLSGDDIENVRFELRSLVSRDTSELSRPLLVSAAVESVAESTCDSLVAPLFYFLIFGVPGAIAYRVVNTADAMIGYRGRYEYLGKFAARLDDVLNFIPARITALILALAGLLCRRGCKNAWRVAVRDHSMTDSPNAGWPMAAAAGALNVQLEKAGQYRLGEANTILVPDTISAATRLFMAAAGAWALICIIAGVIRLVVTT